MKKHERLAKKQAKAAAATFEIVARWMDESGLTEYLRGLVAAEFQRLDAGGWSLFDAQSDVRFKRVSRLGD